jgi:hypothetical protein
MCIINLLIESREKVLGWNLFADLDYLSGCVAD